MGQYAMTQIKNIWVIIVARFFYGFASGVLLSVAPKVLEETIPAELLDKGFGTSTNLFICVGVFVCS